MGGRKSWQAKRRKEKIVPNEVHERLYENRRTYICALAAWWLVQNTLANYVDQAQIEKKTNSNLMADIRNSR